MAPRLRQIYHRTSPIFSSRYQCRALEARVFATVGPDCTIAKTAASGAAKVAKGPIALEVAGNEAREGNGLGDGRARRI
jgi:hypothetical protein